MKIKRRQFLKLSLAQSALAFLTAKKSQAKNTCTFDDEDDVESFRFIQKSTPSILQGATDENSTQFSIVYDSKTSIKAYAVLPDGHEFFPIEQEELSFNPSLEKIHKFYFNNLDPNSLYTLKVFNAENDKLIDEREFKCLDLNKDDLQFAFGSCMEDTRHDPEIWNDLVNQKPDVMFFLGDSVYADRDGFGQFSMADPKRLWERFVRARKTLEIFFSKRLIPCLATWDDHDFGFNDADSTEYPFIEESQRNFLSFFAQSDKYTKNIIKGPGISTAYSLGSHLFILMDNRSYRKPNGSTERYAHWGQEQEEWLYSLVKSHSGTSWIMNGTQMFPSMPFKESFSRGHKINFKALINELKDSSSKLVFCSGDVHFSEVTEIDKKEFGYTTYELTSSSIHSRGTPPWIVPNLNRIESAGKRNYLLVKTKTQGLSSLNITSHSSNGRINFNLSL